MKNLSYTRPVKTSNWLQARFVAAFTLAAVLIASPAIAGVEEAISLKVLVNEPDRIVINFELGRYSGRAANADGRSQARIELDQGSLAKAAGVREWTRVCRSIVIPDNARMEARLLGSESYEISDVDLTGAAGLISPTGGNDGLVRLGRPYILRDRRGLVVELNPFQYNQATGTWRVYTSMTVEVFKAGPGLVNVLASNRERESLAFHKLYRYHFLNYKPNLRYAPLDESGDMLIICHDPWLANVQPLVTHKNNIGISTTAVGVSTIGNDATAIKDYIQDVYDDSDLAFVLLVGDAEQVATPYARGDPSDPSYAKVAGLDDYPDIMVGRFSAEAASEVDTQVQRTIQYESMPATQQDWFWRGAGIGSDTVQLDNIRDALLAHGYTLVDQLYDPGATPAMIGAALNDGRGIINYVGQATATGWLPSGFCLSDVNALANDEMLPFIFNAGSYVGDFAGATCFAEAWLRAQHGAAPTGAIGAYMSSTSQYWGEPLVAQQEFVSLYVNETHLCFGTLCFAGSCRMMDEYGSSGAQTFDGWILFGDPSLRVVGSWEPLLGDLDRDGDVDPDDFAAFCGCMAGPDVTSPPPGSNPTDFERADVDEDGDVDLGDFEVFQVEFTGSGG